MRSLEIPEAILKRKSVRAFAPKGLTDEELKTLIESASCAPSAGNMQPWAFIAVRDRGIKELLVEASHGQTFIATAPVVFVVCADPARNEQRYGDRGKMLYCLQDTAAALENIILTATHNGLATCWIGAFDEEMAAVAVGLPSGVRPIALLPVGYPDQDPPKRPRRPVSEVLHFDKW
jgi:nitroreductase